MPSVVTVFGLIPRYIGGSENYARELSLQLEKIGWNSVICFLEEPPAEVLRYLDLPNTKVEVLAGADGRGPSLATLKHLSTILRANKGRVLHLHLVGFVGLYPWLATVLGVRKVVFTNHMSQPERYVPRRAPFWKRGLVKMINWPMSKVVCVSQYNFRCLAALDLLPESKLTCVYNGVDFSRAVPNGQRAITFRKKYSIPAERTLVAQVSWIITEKGIGDLLEAGRLVVGSNPNVHFVFAGEGAARESFTAQANDLGLADHVTWTGLVRDPFADGLYDAADIVCQPSRWEEAFGQVIAEAMAYAKPVIGTRVGGIPEVIIDGETGFVVERRDVKALADKIQLLAGDARLRDQMGQTGFRIAKAKFDQRQIVNQVINLYDLDQFK
jgi:glycosyltransferase involved in cell wall biosynthesis